MTVISRHMTIGGRRFDWGSRTYVMGVLNVTPDSFSGDGTGKDIQRAVDQALRFEDEGADIIDIGGESTRPASVYADAKPVAEEEEAARVIPVIEALSAQTDLPLSIDTQKSAVARLAVEAGAAMVNDVSMFLGDEDMRDTVADLDVPVVISHNNLAPQYPGGVVHDVIAALCYVAADAETEGVRPEHIIFDPGIGFAKTTAQSLEMQRGLSELKKIGYPVLIGTSRKSSIGEVLGLPTDQRLEGTAATVALAIERGADIVRVHDVKEMVRVARMSDAIVRGWRTSG